MKQTIPIEVTVAVLAGLSCFVTIAPVGLPVWALFIGWAQYFALGATPSAMKKIYPALIPGSLLAALCILFINNLYPLIGVMPSMMISVVITVFFLMLTLKIKLFDCGLAAFNGYSCVFATYYGGFFPNDPEMASVSILVALIWSFLGTSLGPIFGFLSVYLTFTKSNE